jgi:hypothetical protein
MYDASELEREPSRLIEPIARGDGRSSAIGGPAREASRLIAEIARGDVGLPQPSDAAAVLDAFDRMEAAVKEAAAEEEYARRRATAYSAWGVAGRDRVRPNEAASPADVLRMIEEVEREEAARERMRELDHPGGDYVPRDPAMRMVCEHVERTEGRARAREFRRDVYRNELYALYSATAATVRRPCSASACRAPVRAGRRARPRGRSAHRRTRAPSRAGPSDSDGGEPERVAHRCCAHPAPSRRGVPS